ncbi:uncharacterized protein LOC143435570 [Arvicanthis niloticus]|uniref:uncharacterized protein LOC143309938 n=1 Tax=Arvicanthis niloticus TaxID=61156 RepID=UPI00402B5524
MAKATKKTDKPTPDVQPSTSGATKSSTSSAKPKRVKICRCRCRCRPQNKPKEKKCQSGPKRTGKIQKAARKSKNTLPKFSKTRTDEKTAPPTKKAKKAKGKTLLAHYRQLMEEILATTSIDLGLSSTESSSVSSSDQESQ